MICNDEILRVPNFQTSLDTFFAYSSYYNVIIDVVYQAMPFLDAPS